MQIKSIRETRREIEQLTTEFGRTSDSVQLLAVSKTRTPEEIEALADQGQRIFGENYLQEAIDKIRRLKHRNLKWHYIGRIQSNKTRPIAEHFDWVHTVDRLKIARRLSEQRPDDLPDLNICLQVKTSEEETKGGVSFESLPKLAKAVSNLPRLKLRGLMTLPAPTDDFALQREPFRKLREALDSLRQQGFDLDTLSMGTTNDYRAAIAEGATIVRLGTALFGPRK